MRVVFDTNVFVSAFVTEGVCSVLLKRARKSEFELIVCPFIVEEVKNVLSRKLKAENHLIENVLLIIREASNTIHPLDSVKNLCRDKDDDFVLSCAVSANADYLVSGDKDLLIIEKFKGVKIVSPREFEMLF